METLETTTKSGYNFFMGRADRGEEDVLALDPFEAIETGENSPRGDAFFLEKYVASNNQSFAGEYLKEFIYAHLADHPHGQDTGLEEGRGPLDHLFFKRKSPLLQAVAQDPRFEDQLQVMIDLDSTLFPIDRALRELGLDIYDSERESWGEDGDSLGDAIMMRYNRPDLLHGKELSEEQQQDKADICIRFFEELHGDEELMRRAGVFRYAPQLIKEMREQGIRVHILTHRSPEVAEATKAWLGAMGIEYDDFVCDHSHNADKIEYCQERGIPVLLDDKPKTIRDAEAAGIEAISLAWPYSKKALEEAGGDEALCWREMAHHALGHIERLVRERAEGLGVDLGDTADSSVSPII